MATTVVGGELPRSLARRGPWLALLAGLAALYVPTYVSFARGLWRDDAYAHGPIILLVVAWLAWRERDALLESSDRAPVAGGVLVAMGLVLHVTGRAFGIAFFEGASHLPVLAGLVLLAGGMTAVRRLAFPLLLLVFVVPLPGFVLDVVTTPLKTLVSTSVAGLLGASGYPVVRSGVVLEVAGHPMLVADACSGLNSLSSLVALALVYAHVTPPRSKLRMAALLAAIVPIAVAANIVRVTALVLVTVHWGEDAAQGFLHGFAGMVVFVVALALLLAVDRLVRRTMIRPPAAPSQRSFRLPPSTFYPSLPLYLAALAMAGGAIASPILRPVAEDAPIDLEHVVPAAFAGWRLDPDDIAIAPAPDVQANLDRLYSQVIMRTYVNGAGERMMLTVAHGGDQSDALKAHRQEKCYEAQGFAISALEHRSAGVAGREIPVTRMVASRAERVEPVTYWFTMGERVVLGRVERLRAQLAAGLHGRIPDGMLVRVSSISSDPARAFAAQQAFSTALFDSMDPESADRFVGREAS